MMFQKMSQHFITALFDLDKNPFVILVKVTGYIKSKPPSSFDDREIKQGLRF